MAVECPSCPRDFGTERGMRTHHGLVHGESLGKVDCVCDGCGTEFRRWESQIEGNDELYCSRECQKDLYRLELTCETCGEAFERYPSEIEDRNRVFCSKECAYEYGRVTSECTRCGSTFKRAKHKSGRYSTEYCSRECYQAEKEEGGEKAPGWIDGRFINSEHGNRYGKKFRKNRKRALERDGYECHICGKTSEEHKEEYGTELHVHHITPVAEIDGMDAAHDLDNLVTLCLPCHRHWEGIPLKPQVVA